MSYQYNDLTVYYVGGPDSPIKSKQSTPVRYEDIRAQYNKDNLYEDPDFPAVLDSIGKIPDEAAEQRGVRPELNYIWCRPHDICKGLRLKPDFAAAQKLRDGTELKMERISEDDVMQGGLGDCWYLSALSGLTRIPEQVKVVIPDDNLNGFDDDKYCGAFHFRFYSLEESKWVDIVVDDRLPCSKDNWPVFTQVNKGSRETAEFWPALIEKAYAKWNGSFAAINGGNAAYALENLTNGFGQVIDLHADLPNYGISGLNASKYDRIKSMILADIEKGYFVGLSTFGSDEDARKANAFVAYSRLGLITKHAYTILDGKDVKLKDGSGSVFLIKIRNPHAQTEWQGDYSDSDDAKWDDLEVDLRPKNVSGSTNINEGTFWMELADVITYFDKVQVCIYGMKDMEFTSIKSEWPAALQKQKLFARPMEFSKLSAFKFEVAQGPASIAAKEVIGSKAVLAFQVVCHGFNSLVTTPRFSVTVYKVTEAALNSGSLQKAVFNKVPTIRGGFATGRSVNVVTVVEPGTYLLVAALSTDDAAHLKTSAIPSKWVGKPIPFTVRLFTENKTDITVIPPQA